VSASAETVTIPSRFNGPRGSGNGGYTSGVVANRLGAAAEVNLRKPVPLDKPLELVQDEAGGVRLLDGEAAVAEGRSVPGLDLEVPPAPTPDEARRASENYRGQHDGLFSECFVCGLDREDSFGVFAGEVEGRGLVASTWTPPAWAADSAGRVRAEHVWAALDCPTFFAAHIGVELTLSMLVRQTATAPGPVRAEEEHVVMAWPLGVDGRKRLAGAAVLSAAGETLAKAEVLLIEPR
jgi:hypothetical protein